MTLYIVLCCPTALSTRAAEVTVQHWQWPLKTWNLVFLVHQRAAAEVLLSSPGCWGFCCTSALWACGGKHPPKLFPSQWSSVWTKQEPKANVQLKIIINARSFQGEKIIPTPKHHPMDSCLTLNPILLFLCSARLEDTNWGGFWGLPYICPRGQGAPTAPVWAWQESPQHGGVITCSLSTWREWRFCSGWGCSLPVKARCLLSTLSYYLAASSGKYW